LGKNEKDKKRREKTAARIERPDYEMAQENFAFQRNEREKDLHVRKLLISLFWES
jgi:hypothetical protein